jgi:beta-fructofuranosidase
MSAGTSSTAREIRRQMASDAYRPRYHFQPSHGWINDPNGLIQWNGEYHLFYQHNPAGPFHRNIHWGHAISEDLVYWQDLPIALAPSPNSPDNGGCYSGCAVDNNGTPTLMYTGVYPETQCVATGSPDLLTWHKYDGNPVIARPPDNYELVGFRDPCVWREADAWYMAIGSGIKDMAGTVLLYRSPDLFSWTYVHPLHVGAHNEVPEMWECPSFFPLGDKHVLLVSVLQRSRVEYFTGVYHGYKFTPEHHGLLDHSPLFYAAHSFADSTGRRLLFGWVPESRNNALVEAAGWAGMLSLPREVSLRSDGYLGIEPARELHALRGQQFSFSNLTLSMGVIHLLEGIQGNTLELIIELGRGSATAYGVKLLCSPDGTEDTTVIHDQAARTVTIDRTRSCAEPEGIDITPHSGALDLHEGEMCQLHIFLDRSVVEVFANGRLAITSRVYPARQDSLGVQVFARDGDITVKQVNAWQLGSIW